MARRMATVSGPAAGRPKSAFAAVVFFLALSLFGLEAGAEWLSPRKSYTHKAGRIDTKVSARTVAYETV